MATRPGPSKHGVPARFQLGFIQQCERLKPGKGVWESSEGIRQPDLRVGPKTGSER